MSEPTTALVPNPGHGFTLYEIDARIVAILSQVDDDGEIDDNALAMLEALEMERREKVSAILAVIRNQQAVADTINAEIERLKRMAASPARVVDRLKGYLYSSMKQHGETKLDCGPLGKPRIQKNSQPAVKFNGDIDMLEGRFKRITVELDRQAVLAAHKNGFTLPDGVTVEVGDHLRLN